MLWGTDLRTICYCDVRELDGWVLSHLGLVFLRSGVGGWSADDFTLVLKCACVTVIMYSKEGLVWTVVHQDQGLPRSSSFFLLDMSSSLNTSPDRPIP
jgi:hypothetical protein